MPEVASRHHLELIDAGRRRRARAGRRRRSTTSTRRRDAAARAWSARCSSASAPPRRSPPRAGCRCRRSTTCTATSPRSSCSPSAFEPPFLLPDRLRRPHAARAGRATTAGFEVLGAHARRRGRRGVRQGRAHARPRLSRRPGAASGWPRRAIPRRSRSRPPQRVAGPGLLLRRAEDLAALQAARPGGGGGRSAAAPTSPPSYQRAIVEALVAPRRAGAASRPALSGWRSAAASPPTARCASACAALGVAIDVPPTRALHRQRRDDRLAPPASAGAAVPRLPRARRLRHRRARPVTPPSSSTPGRGCHLCDDARAVLERARAELPFALVERDIEPDDALFTALPGAHSGGRARRRGAVRATSSTRRELRRRARYDVRRAMSSTIEHDAEAGASASVGRPPVARRRRAPVALPAGAHAGEEDGQGDDLLAGAVRLHARQLDADPARPVGLRQVRQARRRLQRRLARLADPQDPADLGPAQHRAVRRRPPRPRDRVVGHLRRPRLPRRRDLRHRPAQDRRAGRRRKVRRADDLPQIVEEEDIVVGVLAVPTAAAQTARRRASSRPG